ncbi:MAG: STAS/SEC14 domain-containing protein [Rhodobacteraceae bacterium]|nr:STAS/SEC14 domain-containing protein [Paracoccaceae bacterium]
MITVHPPAGGNILEVELAGEISGEEYEATLVPAIEQVLVDHDGLRMLIQVQEDFSGFDLGAVWADTRMGVSHWRGFDRIAVATGRTWLRNTVRIMAALMPCPVQCFGLDDLDDARLWLRESLGAIHIRDLDGPCVHVQALGSFDPEIVARAKGDLGAKIREMDRFRLLLDLREFDGWQGVSAMLAHLDLGRTFVPQMERAAIVADGGWQAMLPKLAQRFIEADTKVFEAGEFEAAKTWLAAD